MMKIKCIKFLSFCLTVGKTYDALDVPCGLCGNREYLLINDDDAPQTYSKKFFEIVVEPDPDLIILEQTYISLLKMPFCPWRIHNQEIYCDLRNRIAEKTGKSIQETQEEYETRAVEGLYLDI